MSQADANQFDYWYNIHNETLHNFAGRDCYRNYTHRDWPESKSYPNSTADSDNCRNMASCLLDSLDEFDKADMQSAAVLLGLMPTFLQYISPNFGELDYITRRQPLLAFLMVIGAPVISVTRLFEVPSTGKRHKNTDISVYYRTPQKAAIIIVQYTLVAAVIWVCLYTSISVGQRTILSWRCTEPLTQLWWNLMPIIPFLFRAFAL